MTIQSRAQIAAATLSFLEQRYYPHQGQRVSLDFDPTSRFYPGTSPVEENMERDPQVTTVFSVDNETTLRATRRLQAIYGRVLALNFASAKRPGGGFLTGAAAQEESLARSSALYLYIRKSHFYQEHPNALYSHNAIYSPDVPVFRNDYGDLLDQPYPCSFITCAAVNYGALPEHLLPQVRPVMQERITRILDIAAANHHKVLVLGAFGCGVFRNDPFMVAELFANALTKYRNFFDHAHFAVLDHGLCLEAFTRIFGGCSVKS